MNPLDYPNTNKVIRRMFELASNQYGHDRIIVRKVTTQEIIPGRCYEWHLFEKETDTAAVEKVRLDVGLSERLQIDDEVNTELGRTKG